MLLCLFSALVGMGVSFLLNIITPSIISTRVQNTTVASSPISSNQAESSTLLPLGTNNNNSSILLINPASVAQDIPIIMYHDVKPVKDVDWDITPSHLERHFQTLKNKGITPITLDQLVDHFRNNTPLPLKPILLTFDDNYLGEYLYAFPLLKKYNYPAVWSIHTHYVGSQEGKPKADWVQVKEMFQSGLITIASHTVNHLRLSKLSSQQVDYELQESKRVLEDQLGTTIKYFTYPEGDYINALKPQVIKAGYQAALTMNLDPQKEHLANSSDDMLSIMRFGQSEFESIIQKIYN
jgi:peptidoglycan/xylan/chitin deacetylase (PgdA/CDA1 family)